MPVSFDAQESKQEGKTRVCILAGFVNEFSHCLAAFAKSSLK